MLQQQAKTGRQARICRCLRWAGWGGGGGGGGGGPAWGAALLCPARAAAAACSSSGPLCRLPQPEARAGLLRSVQQQRAAPLRAGAYSYPLPLVALARLLPLSLPGPVMRITGVMRGRERPAIAAQLRITEATLYAELGPGTGPLPVSFRTPWPLPAAAADPLRCRSAACEGSAASSREPVQLRCRGSWSEGSGCAAERVRARPARWPGRRRRPSGNARPAAAAAVVRGWGAGAARASGGAVRTSKW